MPKFGQNCMKIPLLPEGPKKALALAEALRRIRKCLWSLRFYNFAVKINKNAVNAERPEKVLISQIYWVVIWYFVLVSIQWEAVPAEMINLTSVWLGNWNGKLESFIEEHRDKDYKAYLNRFFFMKYINDENTGTVNNIIMQFH